MKIKKTGVKELDDYIREVLDSTNLKYYEHGKLIRLSVIRFLKMLDRDDIEFRPIELQKVMIFFSCLPVWDNPGYYGDLFDYQIFQVANILCLYYKPFFNEENPNLDRNNPDDWTTNKRVFRSWYDQIARKNSKTMFATGILLYQLMFDEYEAKNGFAAVGLRCFLSATTTDQALTAWNHLKGTVKKIDPPKKNKRSKKKNDFRPVGQTMNLDENESFIQVLSGNPETKDSLKPFQAIIDEYHAHKTRDMYDVLKSGTGGLLNPLMMIITTAGFDMTAPCFEMRSTCIDILEGYKPDDTMFVTIYEMDDDDEWRDTTKWIKANPALNKIPNFDMVFLRDQAKEAFNTLSAQSNFITKHLNRWVDSVNGWVPYEDWTAAEDLELTFEKMRGRKCFAGIDIASTQDFTAFVYVFPKDEEDFSKGVDVIPMFYLPSGTMAKRSQFIKNWEKQGHINVVEGRTFDARYLIEDIKRIRDDYGIDPVIAYDDWEMSQIIPILEEEGFDVRNFSQTVKEFNEPVKTGERLILNGKISHNGNPVMGWMIRNVIMIENDNGFLRPSKKRSNEKIDGVVALLMGIGEFLDEYVDYSDTSVRFI